MPLRRSGRSAIFAAVTIPLGTVFFSTKGSKGTGLGLFITDRIIRRHGGDITVESSPGPGSRFCMLIPRKAPRQPEAPAPNATTKL
jgi:nitrogen-specific signal transduction histidine kinase